MPDTATQLMDAARVLIQDRGYNAFSYKDLAEQVGIRTASIHYHFPSKGDLGVAVMERYLAGLEEGLALIDHRARTHRARIRSLVRIYAETEAAGAICLCGSLAADQATLPRKLREAVATYVERTEGWLAGVVRDGVEAGEFGYAGRPADLAASLLASLQGALILSRTDVRRSSHLASVQRVFMGILEVGE